MRYQRSFPNVIPLLKAGCSRVTHPSATDPRSKLLFTVRLACVKRAASVRPEPGSNSLVSLYFNSLFRELKIYPVQFSKTDFQFFSLFLTSFNYSQLRFIQALLGIFKGFFWSFIVQFSRFRFTQKLSFEPSLSCETAYLLYHIFLSLSSTFSTFFKFFFDVSLKLFSSRFVCLSRRELLYHIIYNCSCQAFFLLLDNCTASQQFLSIFSDRVHKQFSIIRPLQLFHTLLYLLHS